MTISGGWMIGPAFISARRQRVAARLDHAGKGASDHVERVIPRLQRQHAGRQPLGADGDGDLERPVLARQPRQRAGLGEAAPSARLPASRAALREDHRAERRRAAETPPGHRSDAARAGAAMSCCAKRRSRAQDQLGVADGFGDVSRHQRQLNVVPAVGVLHGRCASLPRDAPLRARASRRHSADLVALTAQNRPRPRRSRCRRQAPRSSRRLSLRRRRLVELSQHEMLHLAQRRAWQIIDKDDVARHLEAGELRQHDAPSDLSASTEHPDRLIT